MSNRQSTPYPFITTLSLSLSLSLSLLLHFFLLPFFHYIFSFSLNVCNCSINARWTWIQKSVSTQCVRDFHLFFFFMCRFFKVVKKLRIFITLSYSPFVGGIHYIAVSALYARTIGRCHHIKHFYLEFSAVFINGSVRGIEVRLHKIIYTDSKSEQQCTFSTLTSHSDHIQMDR